MTDILAVSEHWLYHDSVSFLDSLDENFECFARSSDLNDLNFRWKRGQGGVAIFWRRNLECQPMSGGNDRLVAIKLKGTLNLVICSVYFPSSNRSVSEFKKTLDELEQFCYEQKANGNSVVIMGDFNAHLKVCRSGQTLNSRGKLLQNLLNKLSLCAVNTGTNCEGAMNTYISSSGNSMIDYILVEENMVPCVTRVSVLAETPDNSAFHLPVILFMELHELHETPKACTNERIAWTKCTTDHSAMFIENLVEYLPALGKETLETKEEIEAQVSVLCEAICYADRVLPRIVYNRKIKPYWNEKLNSLKKVSRRKFEAWTSEGRPRGLQYASYVNYKRAKAAYRREIRNSARSAEQQEFEDISNISEIDHVKFWRYVNRKRGNKHKFNACLECDGETISDPNKLANLWAGYYEALFTPNLKFNEQFKTEVDNDVEHLIKQEVQFDGILDEPVTLEELRLIINKLPNGKAPGHDGIFYEHIKMGQCILLDYLVQLFNSIIKIEYIPLSFKLAVKIPIPKGGKTLACTFDDYRGISLLTTFNKILERLVLSRINQKSKCGLHILQGAYRSEHDALTTSFIIDETIKHCCEEGDKVYVCYVDFRKAFDNLWINGMLYKLYYEMGIMGKCLRLIHQWYMGMKEMVRIGNCFSRCYDLLQGTRQGGILSPWLFTVFVNDLITLLHAAKVGVMVYGMYYGSPMYADDLTMISRLKNGLDSMLNLLFEYGLTWRITFNQSKTVTMVFGEKIPDRLRNMELRSWCLGNLKLTEKDVWKNLGKIWHVRPNDVSPIENAVNVGYAAGVELASVGCRFGGINPITASKLWKRVVLPKMLYGSELWQLDKGKCLMLEKCQNVFVRVTEGLLPGTSGSAARGLLGLWSIEGEIEKKKLSFLGRLVNSSDNLAQVKLLMVRIIRWKYRKKISTGFVPDVMKIAHKYNLWSYIQTFLEDGTFPTKMQWKSVVFKAINSNEEDIWREKIASKYDMDRYLRVHNTLSASCWYLLLQRYPTINIFVTTVLRLLCNSFTVNGLRFNSRVVAYECHDCGTILGNPLVHAVLRCKISFDIRENFWKWILDNMPMDFCGYLSQLDDDGFLDVVLGQEIELTQEMLDEFRLHSAYFVLRTITVSKLIAF